MNPLQQAQSLAAGDAVSEARRMVLSGAHFPGDSTGADDRLHITQERQLGAADADNGSAVLTPMCTCERDRPFTVDDPRHIGCFDIGKCFHERAVIRHSEANASYEN